MTPRSLLIADLCLLAVLVLSPLAAGTTHVFAWGAVLLLSAGALLAARAGGQPRQLGLGRACGQPEGRDRDGGGGVLGRRFQDDGVGLDADVGELLGDDEAMLGVAHHDRGREHGRVGDAPGRLLQQAALARQRQKLLGI